MTETELEVRVAEILASLQLDTKAAVITRNAYRRYFYFVDGHREFTAWTRPPKYGGWALSTYSRRPIWVSANTIEELIYLYLKETKQL